MSVLVLGDAALRTLLTARDVVDAADLAFELAVDDARVHAAQTHYPIFADDSFAFVHSAVADRATGVVFKTGTQVPGNRAVGLPTVHATATMHDASTGETRAVLNGTTITTLRTSGGLVSAARALEGSSQVVGVVGSGVQATEFVLLASETLEAKRFMMWSPGLADGGRSHLDPRLSKLPVSVAGSPQELCDQSQIIATCTLSRTPVVQGKWVRPGTTVLTMGSYEQGRCEIDVDCSARADLTVTDSVEQALRSTGPIREAVSAGVLSDANVIAIGDVLNRSRPGRTSDEQVAVFHGNGLGVQDATLATLAYTRACERHIGVQVDL